LKAIFPIPGPLGKYTIFTKLNKGGMANVYLGQPAAEGFGAGERWVAVKTLLPKLTSSKKFVSMFRSEGTLGMMFDHPNIVKTWDVGSVNCEGEAVHYLVMDYVHGRDLGAVSTHFAQGSRMSIGQLLYIAREVLKGLAYAHDLCDDSGMPLHLVNRDVSPANIMLSFEGDVRLIDFGIAQAAMDFRSQIGAIRGKLSYMSPEQVRGLPVDGRSDLFSLSVVLYLLLTGVEPFVGEGEFEQMEKTRAADPVPPSSINPDTTPELEALLNKGLAKNPMERFADAQEMLEAVEAISAGLEKPYGKQALSEFMGSAFRHDIEQIERRITDARAALDASWIEPDRDLDASVDTFEISIDMAEDFGAEDGEAEDGDALSGQGERREEAAPHMALSPHLAVAPQRARDPLPGHRAPDLADPPGGESLRPPKSAIFWVVVAVCMVVSCAVSALLVKLIF